LGLVSPLRAEPPPQNGHVLSERMNASFDEEADPEFHRYCRFLEDGVPFFKKYPISNDINLEKKVLCGLFRRARKNQEKTCLFAKTWRRSWGGGLT
jgi:hypothetical protein